MQPAPEISVIIPVYNAAPYLEETLQSLQAQTEERWECICVDDGSEDESLALLQAFALREPRLQVYQRPAHLPKGGNACRNYGYVKSRGTYIQWFDADDLMLPQMLEAKASLLRQSPELDFVVARMAELQEGEVHYVPYAADSPRRLEDFLSYKIKFLTPGPLFRKSFLQGRALFSVQLQRHQEWEFFSRLVISGCRYQVLEGYHCLRRIHGQSINQQHAHKSPLEQAHLRLFAVAQLNKRSDYQANGLLLRLYGKRMVWAALKHLQKLQFKKAGNYAAMLLLFFCQECLKFFKT